MEIAAQQALGADQLVDLFRFMSRPPENANLEADAEHSLAAGEGHAVEVRGLTFAYEPGKPVLQG